jgi:hypothetical protein
MHAPLPATMEDLQTTSTEDAFLMKDVCSITDSQGSLQFSQESPMMARLAGAVFPIDH